MNFFLCNRCNKKSEDNILNFNSAEILLKNKQNLINNNIIKKIESIDYSPNLNIEENNNIHTSINNINNLEEEEVDELEIIEYPYKKEKKIPTARIKPKQFNNNNSKFNSPNLIEENILKQLNTFGSAPKDKKININIKDNNKKQTGKKIANNNITNENELERKDTMTDPANIAISSLVQNINKKPEQNKEKNIKNKVYEKGKIINNENINNFLSVRNIPNNNHNNKNKPIKIEKKINSSNKDIKKNSINKNYKYKKVNSQRNLNNNKNKMFERKISQNKKISEYNNSIIKKKNLLKNNGIFSNNYNKNKLGNSLSLSTKKKFPKSFSFNYLDSKRKINELNFSQKDLNINDLGDFGYSLTQIKKNNILSKYINNNNNYGVWSSKKKENSKKKIKITHKKVSRTQMKIQKPIYSHITSNH